MGIFIGQLIGFAVIIFVIVKYVAPPVRKLMGKQQDEVRTQIHESETAAAKLAEAEAAYKGAVEKAHVEAARIREDARTDADNISAALRQQADTEVARIKAHGAEQIALQRTKLIRQLRIDLGSTAVAHAEEIVRRELSDAKAQSRSVDRFLDELEDMADSIPPRTTTDGVD